MMYRSKIHCKSIEFQYILKYHYPSKIDCWVNEKQ